MSRPFYFEILSAEPEKTVAFYKTVLGWKFNEKGPQAYWPADTGPGGEPGINGAVMGAHFDQKVINTIRVDSLDDVLAKVEAAGGKKIHGPMEIPNIGLHAYCTDLQGTIFGVLQPAAPAD